jgi:hypothetical protein
MIILTAIRFVQGIVADAVKLRREMQARYPDVRDEA